MTDESTDISSDKSTCIVVRYFDYSSNKIVSAFYDLVDLFKEGVENATAQVIYDAIINSFVSNGIPLDNIIGFGSDGCNTMMGNHNSVKSRFEHDCPGIYIAKCVCHSMAICANEATKMLPRRCEDLAKEIYGFFKNSAKRKAIFLQFQKLFNLKEHKILRLAQTRWLSFHQVINRILEQWEALKVFFVDMVAEEKSAAADRIFQNLHDPQIKLFFLFLDWILPKFNILNSFFQSEKCVIASAHDKISSMYKEILSSFLSNSYIMKHELNEIDPYSSPNQLRENELYLGASVLAETQKILNASNINTAKRNINIQMICEFKQRCRQILQVACEQIKKRYNFANEILSTIHIFQPCNALNPATRTLFPSMSRLCELLPRCKNTKNVQILDDEWRLIAFTKLPDEIIKETEIDKFWGKIHNYKN